jgi:hypothetical protein
MGPFLSPSTISDFLFGPVRTHITLGPLSLHHVTGENFVMDHEEDQVDTASNGSAPNRRILKVRLRQDHVIRLHELRILQGKSIANLLEGILDDYFRKSENGRHAALKPGTETEA